MRKLPFGVLLLLVLTLFVACSEGDSQLQVGNVAMQSAQIADFEERGFLPLNGLPMETLVTMDRAERSAWQKLSSRFYVSKAALSSEYYRLHKSEVLQRITFIYDYAVQHSLSPAPLSFIWEDKGDASKVATYSYEPEDTMGIPIPPEETDSAGNLVIRDYGGETTATYTVDAYKGYEIKCSAQFRAYVTAYATHFEQLSSSYKLYPSFSTFSGVAGITIPESGFARLSVYGTFRYKIDTISVNYVGFYDLCEEL